MSMPLLDTPPPVKPERLDAAGVNACIQSHFGTDGGQYAVLFEVRNGTAWRANRSVDAVVMGLWPSLGMELWGMEVKVSRHDWKRELDDPAKASEVFNYFDRWFLVAPEYVVATGELPEPWGWFVPENGRLRQAREAAKNPNVKAVDRHFLGALLRRTAKTDDAFVNKLVNDALADYRRQHEADVEKRALQRMGDLKQDAEAWIKLRDLLTQKPGDYLYSEDVIAAVRVVLKAGVAKSYHGLHSLIGETERFHGELKKIAGDLKLAPPETAKRRRAR